MQNILVTGASGFVAKNLIPYLNEKKFIIKPFSRNNYDSYDLIDSYFIKNEQINSIVHLAGKAHDLKSVDNYKEYYNINFELTKKLFDTFLESEATKFIFISSIKAVRDSAINIITEEIIPEPTTPYGKSKLYAENYMLSKNLPKGKHLYILRPSMIYGPGNKGNLNMLYNFVSKYLFWPLGAFENQRSYCSVENINFVISEIISGTNINSGIYNLADDESISTNHIVNLIAKSQNIRIKIIAFNKYFIIFLAKFGDLFTLPFNSEKLQKLTENYIVSNNKIKLEIKKELPIKIINGFKKLFNSNTFH